MNIKSKISLTLASVLFVLIAIASAIGIVNTGQNISAHAAGTFSIIADDKLTYDPGWRQSTQISATVGQGVGNIWNIDKPGAKFSQDKLIITSIKTGTPVTKTLREWDTSEPGCFARVSTFHVVGNDRGRVIDLAGNADTSLDSKYISEIKFDMGFRLYKLINNGDAVGNDGWSSFENDYEISDTLDHAITVKKTGLETPEQVDDCWTIEDTRTEITAEMVGEVSEETRTYTGSAFTPAVTVTGKVKDVDYKLTYKDNINAGTAKVIVSGIGDYKGDIERTFTIIKATHVAPTVLTASEIKSKQVTLSAIAGAEYNAGGSWQDSAVFIGLTKSTEYTFSARIKADVNHNESAAVSVKITTLGSATIKFVTSGTVVEDIEVDNDSAISSPTSTKEGYAFGGWYMERTFTNLWNFEDIVTDSMTLYAKFNTVEYSITYILGNGVINSDNNPATYTIESEDIVFAEAFNPAKLGYTCSWDIAEIANGSIGNKTVTASFTTLKNYTINYELNGYNNNPLNPFTYTIESAEIVFAPITREAYTCSWSVASLPTGSYGNKTITCIFTPIVYSITYNLSGGINNNLNPTTYTIESSIKFVAPTKVGYLNGVWNNDGIDEGTIGDLTVTASYSGLIDYTVTYHLNGGANHYDNIASFNITTETFAFFAPTRAGYVFDGWFTDEAMTVKSESIVKGSSDNIQLYAKWTAAAEPSKDETNGCGSIISSNNGGFFIEIGILALISISLVFVTKKRSVK